MKRYMLLFNKRSQLEEHLKQSSLLSRKAGSLFLTALLFLSIVSCQTMRPDPNHLQNDTVPFSLPAQSKTTYTPVSIIENETKTIREDYILGPGDVLSFEVWNRKELSNPCILVGPDGIITVARLGDITVAGLTREAAVKTISTELAKYYTHPEVNLTVKEYNNNKAFVLGRISNPGVVKFPGKGTLLEALSLAGGLPVQQKDATLTKCAIIRGKDLVIWIDLSELLHNGNMALNARIKNNDVIFIPESQDELLYVMGEVYKPGAIRLTPQMTYLDALMMAGGPTKDANLEKTYIIRFDGQKQTVKEINLSAMLKEGQMHNNFQLQDNDVLYVAETGVSRFNYVLKQLLPFLSVLSLTTSDLEQFGVMQKIRNDLWGQEGFVGVSGDGK
jgi:polysaccharide biosynthesis/export protein